VEVLADTLEGGVSLRDVAVFWGAVLKCISEKRVVIGSNYGLL